ncbi:MAG: hypothetical protein PF495_17055, partial [Spirochaetales bacterium]|nr:hypothetical protein [Spirochaetales bacterium]
NKPKNTQIAFKQDPLLEKLEKMTNQRNACSSCYASLIQALRESGTEPANKITFAIGRTFRDSNASSELEKQELLGIGNCTRCFSSCVPGCPPAVDEIKQYL